MRRLRHLLEYAGVLLVEWLIRCLSPRAGMVLADGAGWLWFALDRRRRERALESIAVAVRGGLVVDDPVRLARASCQSLLRVPIEVVLFGRLFRSARDVMARCRFYGDWERLRGDLESGRGGLLVSGHTGNWEVVAWALRFLRVPCRAVVRPIENPYIDRMATGSRSDDGGVIRKEGAVGEILRTLKAGGWVAMMADQNAGRRGTFVPFFGLPASTYATPAVVAVRAGVPMYTGACLRRGDLPMGFDMHVRKLPEPEAHVPEPEAARALLEALMQALETFVIRSPEQYNWIHRRWKSRPPGEAAGPHLPHYAEVGGSPSRRLQTGPAAGR